MGDGVVNALLRDYGVHPYRKWQGAFWRLASLVDLNVDPQRPGISDAAEQSLAWLSSPRRLSRIHKRVIEGRVRRCASQDGLGLYLCLRVGMRGDDRLERVAESLVETQWPDGGWNCDVRPAAAHSSMNETWGSILGLHEYGADAAAARGIEFILAHRVVFSHRTGVPMHRHIVELHYPPDSRTTDALDMLESKRRPDGTWRADRRWWKQPGSKGSNVEVADWGEVANDVLTKCAGEVLAAAGH